MGRPRVEDSAGRWFGAYCRGAAWRQPYARFTTACGQLSICYAFATMSTRPLEEAVERAERALLRIERAVERGTMHQDRDENLRSKVAEALGELDSIIREAGR